MQQVPLAQLEPRMHELLEHKLARTCPGAEAGALEGIASDPLWDSLC